MASWYTIKCVIDLITSCRKINCTIRQNLGVCRIIMISMEFFQLFMCERRYLFNEEYSTLRFLIVTFSASAGFQYDE